jgi:sulfate permease, SulP family
LAAFLFMKNMAELTQVRALRKEMESGEDKGSRRLAIPRDVEVFSIRGAFFFAAVHKLMEIGRTVTGRPRALILDMEDVLHMDASGLHVLKQIHRQCRSRGIRFVLAGVHSQPRSALDQSGKTAAIGEDNIKPDLRTALAELQP